MKVFIAGIDGYLGWSLAQYLATRGHQVGGCDNGNRRKQVAEVGGQSITPIASIEDRVNAFQDRYGNIYYQEGDLCSFDFTREILQEFQPDSIVHLGEMPAAPYSMIDAQHACFTHRNNLEGTLNILWAMKEVCPEAQLVKLGTMGEYGTPNVDIPEGFFEVEFRGRKDWVMFPRKAGSFYHLTKVHDSNNIEFACRMWGLRSTDIMQGVVFGTMLDEMKGDRKFLTRFDIDECFGTAINRFCAQAIIGHPITLFGEGHQRRGFLPLKDSMQCMTLAIKSPPKAGEYRTLNQFEKVYDLTELGELVKSVANELGIKAVVNNFTNPRKEAEKHYYNPDRIKLIELGYKPTKDIRNEVKAMIQSLLPYKDRIEQVKSTLIPEINWDGTKRRAVKL